MKKVISTILAVSVLISSLQITAFAVEKKTAFLCTPEKFWTVECLRQIGFTRSEAKELVNLSKVSEHTKEIKKLTGIDLTDPINTKIGSIFSPQKEIKKGIMFDKIKSFILNNPFWSMVIYSMLYQWGLNYYKKLKTKYQAGKVETAIDPLATMKTLDSLMFAVKGQENAKRKIRSIVLNIVDRNAQYALNLNKKSKKAGPGATVIYMVGPSGVGKSFSADIMRKVLSGFAADPFVIEASDIDKGSPVSPAEQLFGMRKKQMDRGEINEYSPFVNRIRAVPNSVVIINEYDKMQTPELDERLRTIMDQGYINVNGEKIDCSAATFIITSNESSGSVNKGNLESDSQDDGTGSRTFINHDKAFLNRIKVIEFDNLSELEYKEIAMLPFLQLAQRYKQQYKINIDLNGTIDSIAKKVADLNKGARPIFSYLEDLNDRLLNEVVLNHLNKNNEEIGYKVSFDQAKEEFILEKINKEVKNNDLNKVA